MTTIRGRLMKLLLGGILVVLPLGGAAVFGSAYASLVAQLDASLAARVQALIDTVALEHGELHFDFDDEPVPALDDCWFVIYSPSGATLRSSKQSDGASIPHRALPADGRLFDDIDRPDHSRARSMWISFQPRIEDEADDDRGAHEDGVAIIAETLIAAIAIDRGPVDRALGTLLIVLLTVGAVTGLTITALVAVGVRWGLKPLDRLTDELSNVGAGGGAATLDRRFDGAAAPRELQPIYSELNHMLDRVQQTLEREQNFANAAAHELRTPLAELRTMAEVAVKWPDPAQSNSALREVLNIGGELERLVESLLLISRGDATAVNGDAATTGIAPLVQQCLDRAAERIQDHGLNVTVNIDERSALAVPRDALEIIIRNLIDNAIQYTPANGRIAISNGVQADGTRSLIVENGPVQLNADDVLHLFEPFWRAEGSRSDREHFGLGLTVVHRIANAIGVRVEAGLDGDRLRIRVSTIGKQVGVD